MSKLAAQFETMFPYTIPVLFGAMLFGTMLIGIISVFRRMAGFSWRTSKEHEFDQEIERVSWSSARINKVNFNSCLHVIRTPSGFMLKISRLFLGGGRFISDDDYTMWRRQKWLWSEAVVIALGEDKVILFGRASKLFMRHCPHPEASTPA